MRSSAIVALLIVGCALSAPSAARAASIPDSIQEASRDLLELNERVRNKEELTVESVIKAYKGYVHLYEMQGQLAAASSNGEDENRMYERINEVLGQPGMAFIAQTFFEPLHGAETIGRRQKAKITRAIGELRALMNGE